MERIKSNQGYRERPATSTFVRAMRKLQGIITKKIGSDSVAKGPFLFQFEQGVSYSLFHDGDLVARWDCRAGKQYGATSQIEAAIKQLSPVNTEEIQGKALRMLKSSSTMLNNALTIIKEEYPKSGISLQTEDLLILRDISKSETPRNTLYKIPLASAVRGIL